MSQHVENYQLHSTLDLGSAGHCLAIPTAIKWALLECADHAQEHRGWPCVAGMEGWVSSSVGLLSRPYHSTAFKQLNDL